MTNTTSYDEYDEAFAEAPEGKAPTSDPVPPGTYQVSIQRALIEDGYDGHPKLNLHCRIEAPAQVGRFVFPSAGFNPDKCALVQGEYKAPIEFLKQLVARLGMDPPITKASEIPDRLGEMIGRVIEVKVVANIKAPEYPKVYVQRFVSAPDAQAVTGDEIPF